MPRNGVDAAEMPFSRLLAAAALVEHHDFYRCWIAEIRCRRIVEGDMAIFSETDERNVNPAVLNKARVSQYFGIEVLCVAVQIVHCAWMNFFFQPGSNPVSKAGGVVRPQADVFVHV